LERIVHNAKRRRVILYLSHMLALSDGAYETQGAGPELPRAGSMPLFQSN